MFQTSRDKLRALARETYERNPVIIAETASLGSSYKSTLYRESTSLPACQSQSKFTITVRNIDTFSAGRALLGATGIENHGRVACMNMANAEAPGGTWLKGSMGQEETVYSLKPLIPCPLTDSSAREVHYFLL